ncbi:Chaperone DnaJ-domain superfamily protein [Striga hermonthica]|uniref:Chaperone DnaJ-domain superfamily protein n=1 Tax=Striga hermonthica TaxID=68872 RepID=A0A9N7NGR5_STRHE|nr:Chaperone DnaJ-domain superfamily protein [Striga hermonthica]
MAGDDNKSNDFYGVLGLKKECTTAELRHNYKKLALKWHPDRFSASGDPNYLEEAKKKFQAIQQAYSVLSNADKRFLYDVGVYDINDDDDEDGMGEFLNEMATLMTQDEPMGNGNETFEELQQLFDELFQGDDDAFSYSSRSGTPPTSSSSSSSSSSSFFEGSYNNLIRMSSTESSSASFGYENGNFEGFCVGMSGKGKGGESSRKKCVRKGRR